MFLRQFLRNPAGHGTKVPFQMEHASTKVELARTTWPRSNYLLHESVTESHDRVAFTLLTRSTHMMLTSQPVIRPNVVWCTKRTLAAALLLFIGFASNAIADGRHSHSALRAKPGIRSDSAKHEKLDR